MAEANLPRFELLDDDQLKDLMDSADSKNTKCAVKYALKIFEDYLLQINSDLSNVDKLSNSELDRVLQKFYAGARQKNGSLYSKKSMLSIRFGLQRHFLSSKNVDIIKHDDFANSARVFKCFSATLKQKGKGFVKHKPAISPEDMEKIQRSLDLDDPQGLQDKVFIDVMLHFCNRGRENLREMTVDSFEICEEEGKCSYISFKDTLTKNNREDKLEKSQGGIIAPTNGSRCPVASFLRYKSKLNPQCKWFWQRAKPKHDLDPASFGPWYCNAPLGKNTIGDKMKTISSRAGTKVYTNHCLRATSISTLQNAGFRDREIMSVSGHRSEGSLKHYASTSSDTKENMSRAIATAVDQNKSAPAGPGPSTTRSTTEIPESCLTSGAKSESQELRELQQILDDFTNNREVLAQPARPTCNITTNSHAHLSSHQVQAPTFNIQNCVVNIYNK
nr:uncharacterized protein LOC129284148 [Lytechinus pictus]